MTDSHKPPKGLHTHRLRDNPEEARFVEAWEKLHACSDFLADLLGKGERITPSTRIFASTLIQWLGSPVGQSFLEGLGYVRVDSSKK